MEERELVELLRAHDDRGMTALLHHHGPLMRYIIAPILPDAREQEECLSDVAMGVWEKIVQFDAQRGSFLAWLSAITRNTARNRARGASPWVQEIPEEYPAKNGQPEQEILRRERMEGLNRAVNKLPQRDRVLFYRKYYYLQPTAKIAAEMGMTERAVEGRLYRLKRKLWKTLGGEVRE